MPDLRLVLDDDPRSVAPARAALRSFVGDRFQAEDVDGAELVVSELITNAQRVSADARVLLTVSLTDMTLRIEVADCDPSRPTLPATANHDAESGRGLLLVEALAARWGTSLSGLGKCVWAELPVHRIRTT